MVKVRVTLSLSSEVVAWLDAQVGERVFKDRSHAVEKIVWDSMRVK